MNELLNSFKRYFNTSDIVGEVWFDDIFISSNSYYVFFKDISTNKVIALFSKKYFMTVELTGKTKKDTIYQKIKSNLLKVPKNLSKQHRNLEKIAEVVEEFRKELGYTISEYEFWIPHCLVDGKEMPIQIVAGSYGISRELALDYLVHNDEIFKMLYDTETNLYMGLPLKDTYEECEDFPLQENLKYLKDFRKLNKYLSNK